MTNVLALDIGATKMAAGLVDETGKLRGHRSTPTPSREDGDAEHWFGALAALIDDVSQGDEEGCGVGCGGPMTRGGEWVSPLNMPHVREFPLRDRVLEHTGLETFVDNDAKALALGEGWVGGGVENPSFLAMVVSTGVGGGIVLDGCLLEGLAGNAGHIGHVVVEPDGRECVCGGRGCLEAEASGTAIAAITGADPADAPDDVRARTGTLVGRGVASVANLLDLRTAIVSGSVALGYGKPFFDAAQAEIDLRSKLDYSRGTRIVPSRLGAGGPVVGAGALAWRGLGHKIGVV